MPGPVHCVAENGIWLVIGSGKVVQLVKQATIATWEITRLLPDPPKFPELEEELPEPIARSLHFLGGGDVLLVTYMDHGVIAWNLKTLEIKWRIRPRSCKIGYSAVSPNEKILAVTNLYDGIDWYSLNSNHFMDASFQHTTTHTTPENVILPITFVHGNSAVLSGTSYGCARITAVKDWALVEKLRHDSEDIVQALAYSSMGDTRQIVTGVAEKGAETVIRYWAQQSGSKKSIESKSRAEGKLGWAYLATHKQVSTIAIIITFSLAILLAATKWDQIAMSINWTKDWSNFASEDWSSFASEDSVGGPWIATPGLPLRRRPLTTLGRPPPTAVAESQWGEPRSRAFGTSARVAGSISSGAGPAASSGQPLRKAGQGREWQACPSSSPYRGAMLDTYTLSVVVELPPPTVLVSGLETPGALLHASSSAVAL
ncbi:hypothetical protein EDB85DRAFT_2156360 [Lactarius pseudohatsudake]|nr:hypothetical protein EDB85DRAFT_2156360 [Lactarius pseudohatsudake]